MSTQRVTHRVTTTGAQSNPDQITQGRRPNHGRRPWCSSPISAHRLVAARAVLVYLSAGLTACHDPLVPVYRITTSGYVERGATVSLFLYDRGTLVAPSQVTWTGSPATAVTIVSGGTGTAKLTDTGAVTITAQIGTKAIVIALHVATPPTVLFDLQDSGGVGNRDVYRVQLDGQGLSRLTSGTADNEQPTTADTTVIFTSFRDGYAALYTIATGGGTETRLSAAPAPASQPALSADGTRLALISPSAGIDHLWTAASDGSTATLATADAAFANAIQASPTWAPAGDTVGVVTTQYGNAALARLALVTGVEVGLTDGTTTDLSPSWSTSGSTIAFSSTRDGDLGVFLLTLATGSVTRVTQSPGTDGDPTWLQDGRIVYASGLGAATQLKWIDPAHPDSGHVIPTPAGGNPHHPVEIR